MYPDGFRYERARTVEEAVDFLSEHTGSKMELLAGEYSLLPTMKSGLASPTVLIDIGRIDDLRGIECDGNATTIAHVVCGHRGIQRPLGRLPRSRRGGQRGYSPTH